MLQDLILTQSWIVYHQEQDTSFLLIKVEELDLLPGRKDLLMITGNQAKILDLINMKSHQILDSMGM